MEGDTKDSRLKRERNQLDKQKSLKKMKKMKENENEENEENEKDVQKKKYTNRLNRLIYTKQTDTQVETNFATVAEELVLSENIASQVWVARYTLMILLLSRMKYTINLFPTNCQTTWGY